MARGPNPTARPRTTDRIERWQLHRAVLVLTAALALVAALPSVALAQGAAAVDVDIVLDNIAQAANDLEDASFLLTGKLVDADSTEIALEVDMMIVPGESVASAYIIQPDALADNQIVLDGPAVYSYTFLTHQVTIFDSTDPDALGGLLPASEDGASAQISFDLGKVFEGYTATITDVTEQDGGQLYTIRFSNIDPAALILDVVATVPSSDWLPRSLLFLEADGRVLAELHAENLVIDQGLDVDTVRQLPDDAEVIDNRGR
ncbi:MAG TPA: hypothetical protein VFN03_03460 [Trueperaceae bacterium]|nr:hypothetical protein [Trueperaceae bacterium]